MMCSQQSVLGSLWFTNGEAQEMADLAGCGALDLSVLEHHVFPLEKINEALDDGLPARHGGFTNFIITPRPVRSHHPVAGVLLRARELGLTPRAPGTSVRPACRPPDLSWGRTSERAGR